MDTTHTVITSTWLSPPQWLDGWQVIQRGMDIQLPSVWVVHPQRLFEQLPTLAETLLSPDENARAVRFHQPNHVLRFKAAHTVLRLLLGTITQSDPAALRFVKGHHHKPELENDTSSSHAFNLSYTENCILIGLNSGLPIGVDLEWCQRLLEPEILLEACFSPDEIAFICEDNMELAHRFFTLWTRKEAILKLTGEGIGEHLPHFAVLDGEYNVRKQIIGGTPPDRVYLNSFSVEEEFIGCLASPTPLTECFFYRL